MKVFLFSLKHESNSFAERRTPLADFQHGGRLLRGSEALSQYRGANTEWEGMAGVADRLGWNIAPSIAGAAGPSGKVEQAALDAMAEAILSDLRAALPVGAVFAILHGAMQSEDHDDVEGWLLRRLREVVGEGVPIVATLDMHANVSAVMAATANLLVPYRTTPHVDQAATGRRCAELLARIVAAGRLPTLTLVQPPLNDLDDGRTMSPDAPMSRLLRHADALAAADPSIVNIGLLAGFPWGNVACCGPSVAISAWGDGPGPEQAARELAAAMWDLRHESTLRFETLSEAVALLRAAGESGSYIIADYGDCPAGGSPGDNVGLFADLLSRGPPAFVYGIVNDGAAAAAAGTAGVGATLDVALGGKIDRIFSGRPLSAAAEVLFVSDGRYRRTGPVATGTAGEMGPTALLRIGPARVAVASRATAIDDRSQLRHFGIEPAAESLMLLKAMNHFRADFDPIARRITYVDSPSLCSHDWRLFDFSRVRRPIHPLDADARFAA